MLHKGEALFETENVILIGPSGVGKTHLSIALGQLALQRGLSVRFYSVTRLVEQMEKAYNAGTFDEKIRDVNKPKLLIPDELGYIPFTPLHWAIWGSMTVAGVGGVFLLARWLPLVRLDLGGTLVLVVLLALSAPTLAGLVFMGERLHGMVNDWKNKKARKHV